MKKFFFVRIIAEGKLCIFFEKRENIERKKIARFFFV